MKKKNKHEDCPLVSIIIPFYNVEDYFSECLNSIIRQSYGLEYIETILVHDCGEDSSLSIAKSYLPLLGENAKLIEHKKNKGLGGARNTGIEVASGKYLMFIDSDDYINNNVIKTLVQTSQMQETDIVIYNMHTFSELGKTYPQNPSFDLFDRFSTSKTKIYRYEFPKHPELAHSFSACNKLFSKDLFTLDKRFPEKQHHEDALLVISLLVEAHSISLVKDAYYEYRQRESVSSQSITDSLFSIPEHYFEHLSIVEGLKNISNKNPELEYMLLWVSLRIIGSPVLNLLKNTAPLCKEEEIKFYDGIKKVFENRAVSDTYKVGDKISIISIDAMVLLLKSSSIREGRSFFSEREKKYKLYSKGRKMRKLKNNPKIFFKDMLKNNKIKIMNKFK